MDVTNTRPEDEHVRDESVKARQPRRHREDKGRWVWLQPSSRDAGDEVMLVDHGQAIDQPIDIVEHDDVCVGVDIIAAPNFDDIQSRDECVDCCRSTRTATTDNDDVTLTWVPAGDGQGFRGDVVGEPKPLAAANRWLKRLPPERSCPLSRGGSDVGDASTAPHPERQPPAVGKSDDGVPDGGARRRNSAKETRLVMSVA